ncbi:MAG: transglutaminase-like domain-containing protein [Oscillospiraceae bacterium]
MLKKKRFSYFYILFCLAMLLALCGCKGDSKPQQGALTSQKEKTDTPKTLRPNEPRVLVPEATGGAVEQNSAATIDYSNINQGYIIGKYTGSAKKVKLAITGPDKVRYQYVMDGSMQVFPLTAGDGQYTVVVFENVVADQYSTALSFVASAQLENEFLPYLYPNVYVNFNENTRAVQVGQEVAKQAENDLDVVSNVYNYVMDLVEYDYDKSSWVEMGYAPSPDETMDSKKGICFDYAALMATMLRTQGIPTNLQVGWAGKIYHAWVNVYIEDIGWINGVIEFDGKNWKLMDPTFADGGKQSKEITDFINSGANYQLKYKY